MENKMLALVLVLGLGFNANAEERLGLLKDNAAMEGATTDLGEPDVVVEYEVVDENGEQKAAGTAEVQQDPKAKDEVVVVIRNPDGTVKEVRRDKKVMTPTQWGEGLAWYDIGFGMMAGRIGTELTKSPSANGPVPSGDLFGVPTTVNNKVGGISLSMVVRPRILQQRLSLGGNIIANGCDGVVDANMQGIYSTVSCNMFRSLHADFAFLRKGTEGKINEFAIGVTQTSVKIDHNAGLNNRNWYYTTQQDTVTLFQTEQKLILPKFTWRYWTNGFAHPQVDVTVGKGTFLVNMLVRFSPKKKVRELTEKANPYMN